MKNKVDWTLPVETADGKPVRVLCVDGPSATHPVVCVINGSVRESTVDGVFEVNGVYSGRIRNVMEEMSVVDWSKPVETEDGRAVRVLCMDRRGSSEANVVVLIKNDSGGNELVAFYSTDGTTGAFPSAYGVQGERVAPRLSNVAPKKVKREGWVRIARRISDGKMDYEVTECDEEILDLECVNENWRHIATVHIEWEETSDE